jgi:ABC-2 type transport system ATP-binding protein
MGRGRVKPSFCCMDTMTAPVGAGQGRAVIETAGLTKLFGGRRAVDAMDLVVPAGCAFGLLGPNGAVRLR